jgi:leucyl aminopeptidase
MDISVRAGKIENEKTEALVLAHFEGEKGLNEDAAAVDRALKGRIKKTVGTGEFTGKANQCLVLHTWGDLPAERVLLVGLGKKKQANLEKIRQAMGAAAKHLSGLGVKGFVTAIHPVGAGSASVQDRAQAVTEGALLGLYRFTDHRTEGLDPIKPIARMTAIVRSQAQAAPADRGVQRGRVLAEAVAFARDLVNQPSNVMTPTRLAREAAALAKLPGVRCHVLEKAEAKRLGMGAFLAVAQGSQEAPKFIILEYHGSKDRRPPIALVGKSITFDSGGISIKPADKMEQMKGDMAGGAAVLGTIQAAARLKLPVSLVGILPATENMPSGTAIKPGDVVRAMSGRTIEVINTDAEGRMVLADGIAYAGRFKPAAIIDLATLTGACVVALGTHATGLLGSDLRLTGKIRQAGETCGERAWELPLWDVYVDQIKSEVADIKNVGNRGGGAITAAAFLSKFTGNIPWAHLDIAGTAWTDADRPYIPKGASGVGVRLLVEYLSEMHPSRSGRSLARKRSRRSTGS